MPVDRQQSFFSADVDPPPDPYDGEQWVDSLTGIHYTWKDRHGCWIEGGGGDQFPAPSPAPELGAVVIIGDMRWKWNGRGWQSTLSERATEAEGRLDAVEYRAGSSEGRLDAVEYRTDNTEGRLDSAEYRLDNLETDIDGGEF